MLFNLFNNSKAKNRIEWLAFDGFFVIIYKRKRVKMCSFILQPPINICMRFGVFSGMIRNFGRSVNRELYNIRLKEAAAAADVVVVVILSCALFSNGLY